jgi:hypothetical protein
MLGREVATLVNGLLGVGEHRIPLIAAGWASGVYYYRLRAGGHVATRGMVLLR